MIKEGGTFKTWKRRYFVLEGAHLSYQKAATRMPGETSLGVVDLNQIDSVTEVFFLLFISFVLFHCFQTKTKNSIVVYVRTYVVRV